jgi:hypothetical protein
MNTMPRETPADPAELELRLELVRSLIAEGYTQSKVVKYIREECAEWDISERQARNYYYAVWKQYGDDATGVDRAGYFVRTLDRLDYIYARAMEKNDFKSALTATAELIKLLRLDIPSADFDWKKAATDAGVSPSELFEKVVRAASQELKHAGTEFDTE